MNVRLWPVAVALTALSATGESPAPEARPNAEDLAARRERITEIHRARAIFSRLSAVPAEEFSTAWDAYRRRYEAASHEWVRRWPASEIAWRERLRALALARDPAPKELDEAIEGALGAQEWGVGFTADVRWAVARLALAHGFRLAAVDGWIAAALAADLERFPESALRGLDAGEARRGRADLQARAARLRAALAFRTGDRERLSESSWGEAPAATPPDEPAELEAWATARSNAAWKRARLARLAGRWDAALEAYQQAWRERPRRSKQVRPWDPDGLAEEALGLWTASGRKEVDWRLWLVDHPGARLPESEGAMKWVEPGGRLTVEAGGRVLAGLWLGLDERAGAALQRVQERLDHPLLVLSDEADPTALAHRTERLGYAFEAVSAPEQVARLNRFRRLPRLLRLDPEGRVLASASLARWSLDGLDELLGEAGALNANGRNDPTESPARSRRPRPAPGP